MSAGCAGAMRGEWNAPPTSRAITLRMPSSFDCSRNALIESSGPATTHWPGAFRFATTSPGNEAIARRSTSGSAPKTATMVPGVNEDASAMARPRSRTSRVADARSKIPANASALYSPRLWPIARSALRPPHAAPAIALRAKVANWALSVRTSSSLSASSTSRATSTPEISLMSLRRVRALWDRQGSPIPGRSEPCPGKRTILTQIPSHFSSVKSGTKRPLERPIAFQYEGCRTTNFVHT